MLQNECPKMVVHWVRRKKKYSGDFKYFYITVSKYLCVSINDIIYHKLCYGIHNFDFT